MDLKYEQKGLKKAINKEWEEDEPKDNEEFKAMRNLLLKTIKKRYKPRFFSQVGYCIESLMTFIIVLVAIPFIFLYDIVKLIFGRNLSKK